jgi:hypothetical protein
MCWKLHLKHCLLDLNLCVSMMAWVNSVWFISCDGNLEDDGLAGIFMCWWYEMWWKISVSGWYICVCYEMWWKISVSSLNMADMSSWTTRLYMTLLIRHKMSWKCVYQDYKTWKNYASQNLHNYTWRLVFITKTHPDLSLNVSFVTTYVLCDALTAQYVTATVVIKCDNMWRQIASVTKGTDILWWLHIKSSHGTLCDGLSMMTSMTLDFRHKVLFMTNIVLNMTVCVCHTSPDFFVVVTIPLLPLEPPPVSRTGRTSVPWSNILYGVSFSTVRPHKTVVS